MNTTTGTAVCTAIERYGPDEEATGLRPGDFILTHQRDWPAKLIQFGQRMRFGGSKRTYARWNHTAIVTDAQGALIEALGEGVASTHISKYKPTEYYLVRVAASDEDRQEAVEFAKTCTGAQYGKLTIASVGLSLLSGASLSFGLDGQFICSTLVAHSLERTAIVFPRDASHMVPADLAAFFEVQGPPRGTPKGQVPRGL